MYVKEVRFCLCSTSWSVVSGAEAGHTCDRPCRDGRADLCEQPQLFATVVDFGRTMRKNVTQSRARTAQLCFPMVLAIKTVVDCHVDKECKRRLSLSTCGLPIECLDEAAPAPEENHTRLMNVVGDGSYDSDGEEMPSGCWQACHCDDITCDGCSVFLLVLRRVHKQSACGAVSANEDILQLPDEICSHQIFDSADVSSGLGVDVHIQGSHSSFVDLGSVLDRDESQRIIGESLMDVGEKNAR